MTVVSGGIYVICTGLLVMMIMMDLLGSNTYSGICAVLILPVFRTAIDLLFI